MNDAEIAATAENLVGMIEESAVYEEPDAESGTPGCVVLSHVVQSEIVLALTGAYQAGREEAFGGLDAAKVGALLEAVRAMANAGPVEESDDLYDAQADVESAADALAESIRQSEGGGA